MQPTLLTSRANPRYKDLQARLRPSGLRRTHTLLLGAKLMEAWAEAPEATRARLPSRSPNCSTPSIALPRRR